MCTIRCSGHLLVGGGSDQGLSARGYLPRGGVCSGVCLSKKVSALGGVCLWGLSRGMECLSREGVCQGVSALEGVSASEEVSAQGV